jgi:glycerol-3-phosphate acyltransferase PlsY
VGALLESQYGLPVSVAVAAYLLGAIPFGLLLTRSAGLGDVRNIGSGNIGATNVLRTGNKALAAATLLLDAGKGVAAVLLVRFLIGERLGLLEPLAAGAALLGHCYPVWLGFKGGKGVATFIGIAFTLWWPIGTVAAVTWVGALAVFRYSSVAGLAAANVAPITASLLGQLDLAFFFLAVAFLIDWKHRANILRLANGTEPKVGQKSAEA